MKVKKWLTKQRLFDIGKATVVTILVATSFLTYMFTIGIPKTDARNAYNEGILELESGNIEAAYDLFQEAYALWPENYIAEEIARIEVVR